MSVFRGGRVVVGRVASFRGCCWLSLASLRGGGCVVVGACIDRVAVLCRGRRVVSMSRGRFGRCVASSCLSLAPGALAFSVALA